MQYLWFIVATVVGLVLGSIIGIFIGVGRMRKAIEKQSVGNLRIDRSEPDVPPRAFWEVVGNIESISKMKFVILNVINESYISRD